MSMNDLYAVSVMCDKFRYEYCLKSFTDKSEDNALLRTTRFLTYIHILKKLSVFIYYELFKQHFFKFRTQSVSTNPY